MAKTPVALIHVTSPEQPQTTIELFDGHSLKIGRDESNDLVLNDFGASRMHASISASANGVVLADLSSTNGTFVNGERIQSLCSLNTGDIIDIGGSKLRVEVKADELASTLSSSFTARAMTAELKPVPITVCVITALDYKKKTDALSLELVNETFGRWAKAITHTVQDYGGKVDKVIGASLVLIWSGGEARGNAVKAAHAALQVRELTDELSQSPAWGRHAEHPWKCACVLSSGLGLQGVLGTKGEGNQKSFAIMGDPIDRAFRLEEMVGKFGCDLIIEEDTAKHLKDAFDIKKIIRVKIKGAEEGLDTFTIKI